jgi:hypothetical protein
MTSIVGGDKGKSILVKVLEHVKNFITEEVLEEAVTTRWTNKELDKRAMACAVCLENWQKLSNDLHKINRPDTKTYTGIDSSVTQLAESFSSGRMEEIKKIKEKIEKHEKALEKALKGDMKDVYELNQQSASKDKGKDGGKSSEGTTEPTA